VLNSRVWRRLLGLSGTKVVAVDLVADELVVGVALHRLQVQRCGVCRRRCSRYDRSRLRRRWRSLDLGTTKTFIEAEVVRVSCPDHGVVTERVPWAVHDSRFTKAFEEQAAWLAVECSKTAVAHLMRVSWRTVGRILERVAIRLQPKGRRRLAGLRRIGIDEISFRKGHRYLTVVVDHLSGRLLWAAEGRDEETLRRFFVELGRSRCRGITHVSADGAWWITNVVRFYCPKAVIGLDPFHAVAWATKALDEVRREVWNNARRSGDHAQARRLKRSRYALWKNAENLTDKQVGKLAWIQRVNQPLFRAHLLKEHLRLVFQLPFDDAVLLLEEWMQWAWRSRIDAFVRLGDTIANHIDAILVSLEHRLSNALVEAVNTRIRLLTRRAFGFHSSRPLIALAMLSFGGFRPALPGRAA
jgi:transposase